MKRQRITNRRGTILLYTVYLSMMMMAVISLAVDYGRIQAIKTEEQRCADATARGMLELALVNHAAYGITATQLLASYGASVVAPLVDAQSLNPVDIGSGINPTITTVVGSWYGSPASFHNDSGAVGPLAVQVTVSRTAANNNPVPLLFPIPSGKSFITRKVDVWAKAVAVLPNPVILLNNGTVSPNGDPWLMGMTSGSASYDDTAPAESPTAYTVIPGSTLTFTSVTGKVKHMPDATVSTDGDGPDGSTPYWHMEDPPTGQEPLGSGEQNGVADLSAPIDSFIGVFGDGVAPNAASNSSYANPAMRSATTDLSQSGINDLVIQQPFYIGDGTNNSGNAQTFIVPGNANRLYLGIMDGYEWSNNVGSFTVGKLTEQPPIQIVQ